MIEITNDGAYWGLSLLALVFIGITIIGLFEER